MKPGQKRPVAVEDLVRLKRRETPAEDFWPQFDRQLRAKQLAALVGRRPWWQSLSLAQVWAGFQRYQLPLGAAALVAFGLFSIRVNETPPASGTGLLLQEDPTAALVDSNHLAPEIVANSAGSNVLAEAGAQEPTVPVAETESAPGPMPAAAASGSVARLIPLLGAPTDGPAEAVAAALSAQVEPAFGSAAIGETIVGRSLLSSAAQFSRIEARTVTARAAVEPLQQITPPSERRGTRILTAMVSMASVENAMRATERAASRLSEEQLYEQIQRFGARGAGVNVRF